MKPIRYLAIAACMCLAAGAARALDAVVVANESVPVASLSAAALKDILVGKTMYWEGGQAVVIALAGDKADGPLKEASGMDAAQFKTHWQRLAFSGRGQPPKKLEDVEKLVAFVAATKGAFAVLPAGTEAKGLKVLEVK
jgi:hypothetical protein